MKPLTFLFVGVGGQGALSAARFLGEAVFRQGLPVTVSQLHGMSQRGGSVQAAVTVGVELVLSPTSLPVDVLVGLELLEATRCRDRLTPASTVLCSTQLIAPPQAALKRLELPAAPELLGALRDRCPVHALDALALAERAGNVGALNAVLLGALTVLPACPVPAAALLDALLERGAPRARDFNRRAFALGREALSTSHPAAP